MQRGLMAFALCLTLALAASAHDTWLLARRASVAPGAVVLLDLTSGMIFPKLDSAIKPERIEQARCRLNSRTFAITEYTPAPKSLLFSPRLADAGVATLWVTLKPKSLELTPAQVKEYLDEIDAPIATRRAWANARRPRRWREIYTKHAKTFVSVGEHGNDRSWAEPVGMTLEIVPEKDPTKLRPGDEFPVRVLKNGMPLSSFSLGIVHEGNSHGEVRKTDAEGRITFRITRSGRWLLRGTELRQSARPGVDWESDFTTLTIEVDSK